MTTQLLSAPVEHIGDACRGRVLLLVLYLIPISCNYKTLSFLHSFKILVTLRYQLMRLLNDRTGLARDQRLLYHYSW